MQRLSATRPARRFQVTLRAAYHHDDGSVVESLSHRARIARPSASTRWRTGNAIPGESGHSARRKVAFWEAAGGIAVPALLHVRGLQVDFSRPDGGAVHALRGAELSLDSGKMLGLLGESGSGKSTLARALLRLLPRTSRLRGKVEFEGRDLLQLDEPGMARLRGARLCLIPQDSGQALNPVMRIGDQVAEVLHAHRGWPWKRCREQAEALLLRMQLSAADRRMFDDYPHQLSGGQRQRVVIAQALACEPSLLIADEPTASLDAALEQEIVHLLNELRLEQGLALLFITHNPALLAGTADRVAVMYAGRMIEDGIAQRLFATPQHPYTQALLNCMRSSDIAGSPRPGIRLPTIRGTAPAPECVPAGCSFAPRCKDHMSVCDVQSPVATLTEDAHRVECLLYER